MNAPDPSLAVHLDVGMKKITQIVETKMNNSCKYIIEVEDHTLGNIMRMDMIEDPNVKFVGYRVPHPLSTCIEMRVVFVKFVSLVGSNNRTEISACKSHD
ncbi:uncharacterized protein [Blastocystis hominis]|uniref:DNA-directed RNA polymerase RBP11-like dimerisation domain-containing protein n=1 Tax=Blastocystis hominis TaxID=12968 RepID=D8LZM7_BLAHO|nr:uncharacterized protein [Blastocystis hominis]CBK21266.2 unnamed protein product [Blastocystis hominis]|eukprot:XP_012895314.1 uncharacterized protein [Blastocystis hominis]